MRDLFRFLFRQRNNLLFLALLVIGLSMTIKGNMHQRAEWISSSSAAVGRVYGWRNGVMEFANLRRNNADLNVALARERQLNTSISQRQDSASLMNDTVRQLRYRFLTAQVINSTVHKAKNYLTLDKGTLDGIDRNMGVIGPQGIVGVVREASPHFASVISVLNEDHMASAQLLNTKHFGLLRWNTSDPHTVSLADIDKHVPVHAGDTVVTRGSEGVYPPGILIGTVESVTEDQSIPFHVITVRLTEDLTRADHVQVVTDLMRPERDSLEASRKTVMIGILFSNIARFVVLVLLQVLLIDHIDLANGWVVPYLYVLFLLMLPLDIPHWEALLVGFGTGLVLDFFSNTPGMHTVACTILVYARVLMLRALAPREGFDPSDRATIAHMGLAWFVTYAGVLVLLHHLVLFFLEVYRFNDFLSTFARAIGSAAATLVLCLLAQLLTSRPARSR